jgi:hypothetical protein
LQVSLYVLPILHDEGIFDFWGKIITPVGNGRVEDQLHFSILQADAVIPNLIVVGRAACAS